MRVLLSIKNLPFQKGVYIFNIYYMKRIILRDSMIPSILSYRKDGIYIKTPSGMINFNTIYMIDKEQSLDWIENLIDKCECKKHYYQLNDLKKDFLNEIYD